MTMLQRFLLGTTFLFASAAWSAPQMLLPGPAAMPPPGVSAQPGVPVRFNATEMYALPVGSEVELTLPDGTRHPYVLEMVVENAPGIRSWVGRHRDLGKDHRAVVTTGPGGSVGSFSTSSAQLVLDSGANGERLMDRTALPSPAAGNGGDARVPPPSSKRVLDPLGKPSPFVPRAGIDIAPSPKVAPSPSYDVDLMIVYTRGIAGYFGSSLQTQLQFLVTRTNLFLADSEIAMRVRLVRAIEVEYEVAVSRETALNAITIGCRFASCGSPFDEEAFGNVEAMRQAAGADLVMLLKLGVNQGVAWLGRNNSLSTFNYSYVECGGGCDYVFAHELGHNFGLEHDRRTTAYQAGGTPTPQGGVSSYAFGYAYCGSGTYSCDSSKPNFQGGCTSDPQCFPRSPDDFGDIMSYFGSSPKVMKYSNPRISCSAGGAAQPCGIPVGQPEEADAATAINEFRERLSSIKTAVEPPPPPPALLRFERPVYVGAEGTTVTVTVSRANNASGAVQVRYRTMDATAVAGSDYVATEGVLSWGDGDSSPRTIAVNLLADGLDEDNEYFNVQLFEASGAGEAYVDGTRGSTMIVIRAPWPATSSLPAGFANGSGEGWTVASDQAYEGSSSLRSPVVRTGSTNGANSQLFFTGDFNAGDLVFAYRTSLGRSDGVLAFSVDNAIALQAQGEGEWQLFHVRLTAGRHTLTWRVTNFPSTPCAQIAGNSPQCADRAWIDLVTMPIGVAGVPPSFTSPSSVTFTAGSFTSFAFSATGNPKPTFRLVGQLPDNMGFNPSSGIFGTPQPYAVGTYTYTVTATNGVPPDAQQAFTITIRPQGQAKAPAAITLSSSPNPSVEGAEVTLTAPVTGNGAVPTGSVSFRDGAETIPRCSAVTIENGRGVCVTTALAAGSHTISAVYSGDANYAAGATASLTQTVQVPAVQKRVSLSTASLAFGGQSMGTTSPTQRVTVTNTGTGGVTVSGITVGPSFTRTHDCAQLAAGATCTVDVAFQPQSDASTALNGAVAVNATLSIASDAEGSPLSVALSGTAEKSLVTHFYRAILGRAPDTTGKNFWQGEAQRMADAGANVNEAWYAMSAAFFGSAEYVGFGRNDTGFVTDLYRTFFNRAPDASGVSFWTNELANGLPREIVSVSFMLSAEFTGFTRAIFGDTRARAEVDTVLDFYRGLLARLPDADGYNAWVGRFRTAQCSGSNAVTGEVQAISGAFVNGPEYANRARSNAQFVGDLYTTFLRRGGEADGVRFWIGELDAGRRTRDDIRKAFITTPEFGGRVDAIVAEGCKP